LKTILLQFVELRDKKRQADLVRTVLGQLLHFDKYILPSIRVMIFVADLDIRKDQEKWIAAISAK
jgi:hypothetical protein